MDLKQGISYLERERGEGERLTDKEPNRQRYRDTEIQKGRKTNRQTDRANNKNPAQSWVAQLVYDNYKNMECHIHVVMWILELKILGYVRPSPRGGGLGHFLGIFLGFYKET